MVTVSRDVDKMPTLEHREKTRWHRKPDEIAATLLVQSSQPMVAMLRQGGGENMRHEAHATLTAKEANAHDKNAT